MKTIFKKTILLVTAGLFLSTNIHAKDNENPKSVLIADASKIIKEHIKFPNLLMHFNQEEKVNVVFTVNETGDVNLVVANTQNESLKKDSRIASILSKVFRQPGYLNETL